MRNYTMRIFYHKHPEKRKKETLKRYQSNPEKCKKAAEKYRLENPEKCKKIKKRASIRYRTKIGEGYLRQLLKERKLDDLMVYPEMIKLFKILLLIKREIREIKGV